MARPARQGVRGRGWLALVVALLVVAGGVLLVRSTDLFSSGDDDPGATSAGSGSSGSPESSPSSPATEDDSSRDAVGSGELVRSCAAELSSAEGVVTAAAPGVEDWNDHVQARTDMLEGRMPVERMDAIWARTRAAGPGEQVKFHEAMDKHDSMSDCDELKSSTGAGGDEAAGCLARAEVTARAMAAATAAMHDWESHLTNMAAYADGEMSSGMAQDKWVAAWRDAPTHIKAYRDARAELAAAPACEQSRG